MRPKISPQEGSIFLGRSEQHDKVIPVPGYTIPKTRSEHDIISRTVTRKSMLDNNREIPAYAHPFYRPQPNQMQYLHR